MYTFESGLLNRAKIVDVYSLGNGSVIVGYLDDLEEGFFIYRMEE